MNQTIIQGIGYVALFSLVFSFQRNKRSNILLFQIIATIVFTLHYYLLHAWIAVAMNAIEALRTILFYQKDMKVWAQHPVWMYISMGAFILAGLIIWTDYSSLLLIIATVVDTFALWKSSTRSIRFLMLISRPLWFVYNFLVGSYAGMTTEVLVLASVLIGIVRFDVLKNKKEVQAK